MVFGLAESNACTWVKVLLPVLSEAGDQNQLRPTRARGRSREEIIQEFPERKELGVHPDGTERPVRRPKEASQQHEEYSGQKKRQTKNSVPFPHPQTQALLAGSEEAPGSRQDKKIVDDAQWSCPSEIRVQADTGLQGLEMGNAVVLTPLTRTRKKKGEPKDEVTPAHHAPHAKLAAARLAIEHSTAGFQRNRSLTDVLRNTSTGISDLLGREGQPFFRKKSMEPPGRFMRLYAPASMASYAAE
jgi:hypothetical protein